MTTTVTVTVAGHQVAVTETSPGNTEGRTTTLTTQGETRTFHAHAGNAVNVTELENVAVAAADRVNVETPVEMDVGGRARELTDADFEKHGLSPGTRG